MLPVKVDSEPSQTSKLKLYPKTANDSNPLTIIEKISTPDVRLGSECVIIITDITDIDPAGISLLTVNYRNTSIKLVENFIVTIFV